ncbi:TPA: EexN family lipoprotein [Citrobacter freundii]|nr:EexN family lipoprotein [Citrobacter freundii]
MKRIFAGAFLIVGVVFLNGCEEKESTQTIEYFIKNKDARLKMIQECRGNPKNEQNCENASKANMRAGNDTPRF